MDTIHDLYLWKLSKRLRKRYDRVETNVIINKKSRTVAEIDILAYDAGKAHVYEVKCSFRYTKAKQQFKKIRKHYEGEIKKFFLYCGRADQLIEISV